MKKNTWMWLLAGVVGIYALGYGFTKPRLRARTVRDASLY